MHILSSTIYIEHELYILNTILKGLTKMSKHVRICFTGLVRVNEGSMAEINMRAPKYMSNFVLNIKLSCIHVNLFIIIYFCVS